MDCKAVARPRQRTLLMPGASSPSALSTPERRMPPDSVLPWNSKGNDPAGMVALGASMEALDFRGTYTVVEAAEILQVTKDKTYDLIHTGLIPYVQVGRQYRVGRFALWAHINGLQSAELVEQVMRSFVRQHCCRADQCGQA